MPKAKEEKKREAVTLEVKRGTPTGPIAGTRRTFSKQDHGDDFEQEAERWAKRFSAEEVI